VSVYLRDHREAKTKPMSVFLFLMISFRFVIKSQNLNKNKKSNKNYEKKVTKANATVLTLLNYKNNYRFSFLSYLIFLFSLFSKKRRSKLNEFILRTNNKCL
jgi:hypothetical protein